jgi:hypothetical protein
MITKKFTSLNPDNVKKDFPKTVRDITSWLGAKSPDGKVDKALVDALLYANPFSLRDYFDEKDIKIAIVPQDSSDLWTYYNTKDQHSYSASSRTEAEVLSLTLAFKQVEEVL